MFNLSLKHRAMLVGLILLAVVPAITYFSGCGAARTIRALIGGAIAFALLLLATWLLRMDERDDP